MNASGRVPVLSGSVQADAHARQGGWCCKSGVPELQCWDESMPWGRHFARVGLSRIKGQGLGRVGRTCWLGVRLVTDSVVTDSVLSLRGP